MIRVLRGDLAGVAAECRIRPMRSDGESVSAVGQRLEATAGDGVMARVLGQGDSPVGTAILTPSGGLPGDFLIHVVLQSAEEVATAAVIRRGSSTPSAGPPTSVSRRWRCRPWGWVRGTWRRKNPLRSWWR